MGTVWWRAAMLGYEGIFPPEAPPMPGGEMGDEEVKQEYVERETKRLQVSIQDALKKEAASKVPLTRVVAVHFPPLYSNGVETAFSKLIQDFAPKVCIYGHLHGKDLGAAKVEGTFHGVSYRCASCDQVDFTPTLVARV